jgi:rsbT co-antagonist protein RsbR
MSLEIINKIPVILKTNESEILQEWLREQLSGGIRKELIREAELREECREFLQLFTQSVQRNNHFDIQSHNWQNVRDFLASISRTRSQKGFTPSETATFVFSLKQTLFKHLQQELNQDINSLLEANWLITNLLDNLGLWTTEIYQKNREEIIRRQQEELMELSTPVVKLWDGILAIPIIGTLDSARTQVVMESLLQKILETGSEIAIIDITGVPTVDTLTAQHLLKTVTAARLMGAECLISGVRPQIAQTIVYLGVDLADIVTKATLADAFRLALKRIGCTIKRPQSLL